MKPNICDLELEVDRFSSQMASTLGLFFNITIGREFLCFTLEDEYRTQKIFGKTRIPPNRYRITLRKVGQTHQKYLKTFGAKFHKGMLWVRDVPGFEFVLVHRGNKDEDTAGCLLVGNTAQENITEDGYIGSSTAAYLRIYPPIAKAILSGKEVFITFIDYDTVTRTEEKIKLKKILL